MSRSHYGIEHWLSNILVFSIVVDHQKESARRNARCSKSQDIRAKQKPSKRNNETQSYAWKSLRCQSLTPNVRRVVAEDGRVCPRFIAERDGFLVIVALIGDVLHGELHVLVPDSRAKVCVEDVGKAVRVEDGERRVEVDEASLFVREALSHGEGGELDFCK